MVEREECSRATPDEAASPADALTAGPTSRPAVPPPPGPTPRPVDAPPPGRTSRPVDVPAPEVDTPRTGSATLPADAPPPGADAPARGADRPARETDVPPSDAGAAPPEADVPPSEAGAPVPETYAALLADLGALLDAHEPHEVVVLLRAELERRELRAYSHGWRDAAAHFEPAVEAARSANLRTLRLVGRTPGRAAVIPIRQEARGGDPREPDREDGLPDDVAPHVASHAAPHAGPRTDRDADADVDAQGPPGPRDGDGPEGGEPGTGRPRTGRRSVPAPRPARTGSGPEPALVPKSRSSRVPTIPTLPAPRLRLPPRRPADGGRAAATEDTRKGGHP